MYEDEEVIVQETEQEATPVEVPETQPEPKEKTVPLNKFLSEKERRKSLERRIAELEKSISKDDGDYKEFLDLGFEEPAAKAFAAKFQKAFEAASKKTERDEIAEDIADLVEENEYYDDAKSYEKEIRELIKTGKAPDVKVAYNLVRDPIQRVQEIQNRGKAAPKPQPSSRASTPVSDALTETEQAELKELQRTDRTWTAESYKKFVRPLSR